MKKLFLFLLIVCLCGTAAAQVKLSVQGGTTLNGWTPKTDYDAKFGYRFGVGVDFNLKNNWGIQTGLQLLNRRVSTKGDIYFSELTDTHIQKKYFFGSSKVNAIYLHLPVKATYAIPFSENSALILNAGVYVECGVGGKIKERKIYSEIPDYGNDLGPSGNESYIGIDSKDNAFAKHCLKRMDVGLSLGVDYCYRNIFIGVSGEYGLIPVKKNLVKNMYELDPAKVKYVSPHNLAVELHIGYRFCLGKK